jgi:hypothetical protein
VRNEGESIGRQVTGIPTTTTTTTEEEKHRN